jgi:lipopolysaccharide/colanic/teichoic acid biosynthesis glycosyltransferase
MNEGEVMSTVPATSIPPLGRGDQESIGWAPRVPPRAQRTPWGDGPLVDVEAIRDWREVLATLADDPADPVSPVRRAIECVVAAVLLLVSLPIMIAVAIIIRCDSPGPALFRHRRIGLNGRLFAFTKFRTLYADAKERWPELYAYQYSTEQIERLHFKIQNDPRVTRVGRWLRKSTLDELPNLWHVLTGDLSLVGPRPEIPEMLPYYDERGLKKFRVRPGVTGLAQVSGRGNLSFFDTVKLDVDYVERRSAWLDVKIIAATLVRTLRRDGAF